MNPADKRLRSAVHFMLCAARPADHFVVRRNHMTALDRALEAADIAADFEGDFCEHIGEAETSVCRGIVRLLTALDMLTGDRGNPDICKGRMVSDLRNLREWLLEELSEAGWSFHPPKSIVERWVVKSPFNPVPPDA